MAAMIFNVLVSDTIRPTWMGLVEILDTFPIAKCQNMKDFTCSLNILSYFAIIS